MSLAPSSPGRALGGSSASRTAGTTSDTSTYFQSSETNQWLVPFNPELPSYLDWYRRFHLGGSLCNTVCRLILVCVQNLLPSINWSFCMLVELELLIIVNLFLQPEQRCGTWPCRFWELNSVSLLGWVVETERNDALSWCLSLSILAFSLVPMSSSAPLPCSLSVLSSFPPFLLFRLCVASRALLALPGWWSCSEKGPAQSCRHQEG